MRAEQNGPSGILGSGLVAFIGSHVVLQPIDLFVIATWVLASWMIDVFDRFPHLAIFSPTKRCGKTRLLLALAVLCRRSVQAANMSAAVLYRATEQFRPTLLIDEAQWLSGPQSEAGQAIHDLLCAGVERNAVVMRCGGADFNDLLTFHVYSPKAYALIGEAPDVLADRSLRICMQRKPSTDRRAPWRSRHVETQALPLARKCARWAKDMQQEVARVYDSVEPFALENDRFAEMLLPLQAVIKTVDPKRLRELAAYAGDASHVDVETESVGIRLLAALREVFGAAEYLRTEDIIKALRQRKEESWGQGYRGQEITPHAMARLLRPFGIRSSHSPDKTTRGYYAKALEPAWTRYLATPSGQTSQASQTSASNGRRHGHK